MSISRDLPTARKAFEDGNKEMSRQAHNTPKPAYTEPGHNGVEGTFRMCLLLGGFEGIVASTVIIAALSSINVPIPTLLSVAIGCLVALSTGFGLRDFIRYRSDVRHYQRERSREKWELENFPDGERKEMVELYVSKGLREEDARKAIETMSKRGYEEFFCRLDDATRIDAERTGWCTKYQWDLYIFGLIDPWPHPDCDVLAQKCGVPQSTGGVLY